jgi:hypothetical protein
VRLLHRSVIVLLLAGLLAAPHAQAHAVPAAASVTAVLSAPAVPVGRAVAVSGAVTPAVPGQVATLERSAAGTWHGVAQQGVGAAGPFRFVVAPGRARWWSYRVTAGPLARSCRGSTSTAC